MAALFRLGAGGTGVMYLIYFGSSPASVLKTSAVAYLMPAVALFYRVVFLGKTVSPHTLLVLTLTLASVAGVTGALKLPKRFRRAPRLECYKLIQ